MWKAKELEQNLLEVARLRMEVFRDFPYLYEGSLDYEKNYLGVYLKSGRSHFIAAKDEKRLIGLSSCIPLKDENDYVQEPFKKAGLNLDKIFYFGESILLTAYRGRGLGHAFFDGREKAALSYGEYDMTCFCAVERPPDHALRPPSYKPLDEFWRKRGYEIHPQLKSYFSWQDIGDREETLKPMIYWMKKW